jgi:hypothetical protein
MPPFTTDPVLSVVSACAAQDDQPRPLQTMSAFPCSSAETSVLYSGPFTGDYNKNPFASSNSLDINPFDDPPQQPSHSARLDEIQRREADLERRETELHRKAEHIRMHGRNNWPFCG